MRSSGNQYVKYKLIGMDCAGCAVTIEKYCSKIIGVEKVEVNFSSSTLTAEYSKNDSKEKLEQGVKNLGYTLSELNISKKIDYRQTAHLKVKNHFKKKNKITAGKKIEILSKINFSQNEKQAPFEKTNGSFLKYFQFQKNKYLNIVFIAFVYLIFSFIDLFFSRIGNILFTALSLFCLFPILKKVVQYFKVKFYFSVEFLMTVAVIGALFINSAKEAAMVMLLFMIGEALEGYTSQKASQSIEKIASLIPETANLVGFGKSIRQILASEVLKNQIILVKPGERFPVDGNIILGETYIDESLLTGEVVPVHKKMGFAVYAGSLNTESPVQIKTTNVGKEHTVARLVQLVKEAQGSKSKTLRTIEKFSQYYTPTILLIGLLTAILPPLLGNGLWFEWIYRGLAILLIACPCALIISTPSAIASSISSATKFGVLIKQANALELLGKIKHFAFDKTGTLTEGMLLVTHVESWYPNFTNEYILQIIHSLEEYSNHPLAKSILNYTRSLNITSIDVTELKTLSGVGISAKINEDLYLITSPAYANLQGFLTEQQKSLVESLQNQGNTICILSQNNKTICLVALQDRLKAEAKEALNELRKLNISPVILTGDHTINTRPTANFLNTKFFAELLPEQKLEKIRELSSLGKVAMIGDGINDAPALSAADVGIAMGQGTDVAIDSAQIVITNKNLMSLVKAVRLSRKTLNVISQNIFIALFLKFVFLYLTFLGDTRLWMAILADTGATVIVTLNSLTLLRRSLQST